MSSFSAGWLALREPADTRARSARLADAVAGALPQDRPVRVLDLGAGTGSNARYLASRLPLPQRWLLADRDEALLARARERIRCPVETVVADLARLDDQRDLFADCVLVTASALLDLVSGTWLREVLARCIEVRAAVLFALSYDGRIECLPEDAEDAAVRDLVNRHQLADKGFGPALGPQASDVAVRLLAGAGYEVLRESSDWVLTADDRELQRQLIEGWAEAARAIAPSESESITRWCARRTGHVSANRSRLVVGHEDVAAWPSRESRRSRPREGTNH